MSDLVVFEQKPLSVLDVQQQVNLIQEVMKSIMKRGEHYGTIPGCGNKPTLLKPGAEKIIVTFRLCPDFMVDDLSVIPTMIRYRVKCNLSTFSGVFVGAGVGECSTMEDKYQWKKASDKEYESTPIEKRRIKHGKYPTKQVVGNPYDLANTVLKMAKKRALVDACLTTTAASDIFTQDIEDIPLDVLGKEPPKTIDIVDDSYNTFNQVPKESREEVFSKIIKLLGELGGDSKEGMKAVFAMTCTAKDKYGRPKEKVSSLTIEESLELIDDLEKELSFSEPPDNKVPDRDVPVQDDKTEEIKEPIETPPIGPQEDMF